MEEVIFGIDIQSSDAEKNLASLTAKIADNRKLLREQKKALDEVNKTYGVGSKQSIQAAKGVDQLTAETKGLVAEQKQQVKQGEIVAGSLNDQRNQLNKLIKQYDNIPRGTKASKTLSKQIVALTAEVKKGEQATERFGRGVGNYKNNVREALKETGLFSNQLRILESVQNTTNKIFGTSIKTGKGLALALGGIGVAAVAVFKLFSDGIKVFREFTKASSDLQAILGTTKEGVSALNEDAKRLGSTTEFTASQVTKLQTEFAKLGFSTKEILDSTEATLGFASATGVELPRAATLAGSAVRAFGLESKETGRVVDVLTKATTISALDFAKLETAIAQVAPVSKNAGVSIEETTALLGTLSDAGVDASTAGTGLRNILLDVADKGLDFNEALEDINTSTDKNARALELFGKRGAVVATIIAENQEKTAKYSDTLENSFGTAVDIANQKLDNLDGDLTKLSSAWEGLLLNLTEGNGLFGKLTRGAVQLTTSFVNLFNSQEKQSESLEQQRVRLNLLVGAIVNTNNTQESRIRLIKQAKEEYPELLKNIDAETASNQDLLKALEDINKEFLKRVNLQIIEEDLTENTQKLVKLRREELELIESIASIEQRGGRALGAARANAQKQLEENRIQQEKTLEANQKLVSSQGELNKVLEEEGDVREENSKKETSPENRLEKLAQQARKEFEIERNKQIQLNNLKSQAQKSALINEKQTKQEFDESILEITQNNEDQIRSIKLDSLNKELEDFRTSEQRKLEIKQEISDLELEQSQENFERQLEQKEFQNEQTIDQESRLADFRKETAELVSIAEQRKDAAILASSAGLARSLRGLAGDNQQLAVSLFLLEKGLAIASVATQGAQAISSISLGLARANAQASLLPPGFAQAAIARNIAIASTQTAQAKAVTGLSIATIAAQSIGEAKQFEEGGVVEKYAKGGEVFPSKQGGFIRGNSHANGGVKFKVGGVTNEAEGGEIILTKRVGQSARGRKIASDLNASFGGKKFQSGDILGTSSIVNDLGEQNAIERLIEATQQTKIVQVVSDFTDVQDEQILVEDRATV